MSGTARPSRRRQSVRHYTDDNPNTFTVKPSRSTAVDHTNPDDHHNPGGRVRARTTARRRPSPPVVVNHNPTRKRRREETVRSETHSNTVRTTPHNNNNNNKTSWVTKLVFRQRSMVPASDGTGDTAHRPTDTCLSHDVSFQPLWWPANDNNNNNNNSSTTTTPSTGVTNRVRNTLPPPPPPTWTPLRPASAVRLARDGHGEPLQLPPPAITSWENRRDGGGICVGDAAGTVTLYYGDPSHGIPGQSLDTTAALREAQRPILSKKVMVYPNAVTHASWQQHVVVLETLSELEAWNVRTHTRLWTLPLGNARHDHDDAATNDSNLPVGVTTTPPLVPLDLQVWPHDATQNHTDYSCRVLFLPSSSHVQLDVSTITDDAEASHPSLDVVKLYCLEFSTGTTASLPASPSTTLTTKRTTPRIRSLVPEGYNASTFLCHAAVWDTPGAPHQPPRMALLVAQMFVDDTLQLLRVDTETSGEADNAYASIRDQSALTAVPSKTSVLDCSLTLTPDCVLICTPRGIRCHDRATLQPLTVYGEHVALHGQTVCWQRCLWVPEPASTGRGGAAVSASGPFEKAATVTNKKKQSWWTRADEVDARLRFDQTNGPNEPPVPQVSHYVLVGLPHPVKGPEDLNGTIYIWKPSQPHAPLLTLPAPTKSGGLLNLHVQNSADGWKLATATFEHGQGWEMRTSLKSSFAGTMYPVGYSVIPDNVEYVEDEDELDTLMVPAPEVDDESDNAVSDPIPKTPPSDQDFETALRLSLLEQHGKQSVSSKQSRDPQDEEVSVLDTDDGSADNLLLPTRLDLPLLQFLQRESNETVVNPLELSPPSGHPKSIVNVVFSSLPQFGSVKQIYRVHRRQAEEAAMREQLAASATASLTTMAVVLKPKSKRTRTANVEALLQASIDPTLRRKMLAAGKQWAEGDGSRLRGTELHPDADDTNKGSLAKPPPTKQELVELASQEEKELAFELLCLSPSKPSTPKAVPDHEVEAGPFAVPEPKTSSWKANGTVAPPPPPTVMSASTNVVTALPEHSPPRISRVTDATSPISVSNGVLATHNHACPMSCAACRGRMVRHVCGKREKPVDYDAIARKEREIKEREEAEKQRLKAERRRAAEARRREARRRKKEEEAAKRREDDEKHRQESERMRLLEQEQFERARILERDNEPVAPAPMPTPIQLWSEESVPPQYVPPPPPPPPPVALERPTAIPSFSAINAATVASTSEILPSARLPDERSSLTFAVSDGNGQETGVHGFSPNSPGNSNGGSPGFPLHVGSQPPVSASYIDSTSAGNTQEGQSQELQEASDRFPGQSEFQSLDAADSGQNDVFRSEGTPGQSLERTSYNTKWDGGYRGGAPPTEYYQSVDASRHISTASHHNQNVGTGDDQPSPHQQYCQREESVAAKSYNHRSGTEESPAHNFPTVPLENAPPVIHVSDFVASEPLSTNDALAALAGLANSMMPEATEEIVDYGQQPSGIASSGDGWSYGGQEEAAPRITYDYAGSSDRRSAILAQFNAENKGETTDSSLYQAYGASENSGYAIHNYSAAVDQDYHTPISDSTQTGYTESQQQDANPVYISQAPHTASSDYVQKQEQRKEQGDQ